MKPLFRLVILRIQKNPNLLFLCCFLILHICGAAVIVGRIVGDVLYNPGQILQLIGKLGASIAVAGIGIFELLYPGQDILTRWKPIPSPIREIGGRLVGIIFLIIAILIILEAISNAF